MSITYTTDRERDMNVVKDLADYYNFEVAMFHWRGDDFHFEEFFVAS